jgi:hypothetical protein
MGCHGKRASILVGEEEAVELTRLRWYQACHFSSCSDLKWWTLVSGKFARRMRMERAKRRAAVT